MVINSKTLRSFSEATTFATYQPEPQRHRRTAPSFLASPLVPAPRTYDKPSRDPEVRPSDEENLMTFMEWLRARRARLGLPWGDGTLTPTGRLMTRARALSMGVAYVKDDDAFDYAPYAIEDEE